MLKELISFLFPVSIIHNKKKILRETPFKYGVVMELCEEEVIFG